MIFRTESGSYYQIEGLKARRVSGLTVPTARLGHDRTWRALREAPVVLVGTSVLFQWADGITPPAVEGATPATLTSPVVEIVDEGKGTA